MAHRHFEGALHAQLYGKYRPIPPTSIIERLVNFLKEKYNGPLNTCYDVGCGSGQSTGFFANHFRTVVGTDISPEQIRNAQKLNRFPNVQFIVSPAEKFEELKDSSIELITACQAAHWFNLPEFYKETHRVLGNNGVLSLYGYEFPCFVTGDLEKDKKLDERLQNYYASDLKGHWDPFRKYVDRKYTDSVFTFARNNGPGQVQGKDQPEHPLLFNSFTREEGFYEDVESSLDDMINYCLTWSGYQNFLKTHGEEKGAALIKKLKEDLYEILDSGTGSRPEDLKFLKRTKFFLLMGRKESST